MTLPQLGLDYDVAVPEIKCNADKVGATVFLVPAISATGTDALVLAFDSKTAAECGTHYLVERAIARRMAPPLSAAEVLEVLEVVEN